MKRAALIALAGLTMFVGSATAQDAKTWMPGRYYLHPDGTGVHITHVGVNLQTGKSVGVGEVIQTGPGGQAWTFKLSNIIVELGGRLGPWMPANLCTTQPRYYCDNERCWQEVDRYLQTAACPRVPVQ